MTDKEIANDCIRYCIIKGRNNDSETVLKKIIKALHNCDMSKQSIHECIVLLQILEEEMP